MARHPVCPDIERLRRAHHAEGNGVDWSNQVRMKVPRAPTRADRRMGGRRCPAAGRERLRTVRRLGLAAQPVARPNACANGRRSWPVRRAEERDRALQGRACRSAGRWGRCADAPGCDPEHWTIGPPSIRSRPATPLPEIVMALQLDLVPRPARIDVQIDGSFLAH